MNPQYATTRTTTSSGTRWLVALIAATAAGLGLVAMHGVDERAYTHCVQTQTNFYRATHQFNPYAIPDTSACTKAWP